MGCDQSTSTQKGVVKNTKDLSGPTGKSLARAKPETSAAKTAGEVGADIVTEQQSKAGPTVTNIAETREEAKIEEPSAEQAKVVEPSAEQAKV